MTELEKILGEGDREASQYDFKLGRANANGMLVIQCKQVDLCTQGPDVSTCLERMAELFRFHAIKEGFADACPDDVWTAFSNTINDSKDGDA